MQTEIVISPPKRTITLEIIDQKHVISTSVGELTIQQILDTYGNIVARLVIPDQGDQTTPITLQINDNPFTTTIDGITITVTHRDKI